MLVSLRRFFAGIDIKIVGKEKKEMEETTSVLDTLTSAFGWVVDNFTDMASTLLSTPLFLIPVAIFAVGACIGLVRRLV